MLKRFRALSERARRSFGRVAHEPRGQDGVNCLLLALLDQVDVLGLPLPPGFDVSALRSACRQWMLDNKTLVMEDVAERISLRMVSKASFATPAYT